MITFLFKEKLIIRIHLHCAKYYHSQNTDTENAMHLIRLARFKAGEIRRHFLKVKSGFILLPL